MPVFIDLSASTNGTGTLASPYNVIPSWSTGDGDFRFKEGTVHTGLLQPNVTGSAGARKSISTYRASDGEQITSGALFLVNGNGANDAIRFPTNVGFYTVRGIAVTNPLGQTGIRKDITGNDESLDAHVWIEHCRIYEVTTASADLGHGAIMYGKGNRVVGCSITKVSSDGVQCWGDDFVCVANTITDVNRGSQTGSGDCVSIYDSLNPYVARNVLHTQNPTLKQSVLVRNITRGTGGIIEDNDCSIPAFSAAAGQGGKCIFVEQADAIVRRNRTSGGEFGIWLQGVGAKAIANLVRMTSLSPDAAIAIRANSVIVEHNTLIGNGLGGSLGYGVSHNSTYTSVSIQNNLIHGFLRAIRTSSSGATENYNWIHDCTQAVVDNSNVNKSAGAQTTIGSDPLITPDGRPLPGSPLIGAGIRLPYVRIDAAGHAFQSPPSIGAYEYVRPRGALTRARTARN